MALIANMVIKNEADRYLIPVLDNLVGIVDKIVITDDYSTDASVEIAKGYTSYVYTNMASEFEVHEGLLRQKAWNNLSQHAQVGDWVLCIDADEIIDLERIRVPFRKLLNQTRFNVIGIKFFHMWNETHYRSDKAWHPNIGSRLFRYIHNGQFSQKKLACGSEPTYIQPWIRQRLMLPEIGIDMKHLGYMKDEDKKMKYERYMKIDQGDFHSLNHIKSIIDPNPILVKWEDRV